MAFQQPSNTKLLDGGFGPCNGSGILCFTMRKLRFSSPACSVELRRPKGRPRAEISCVIIILGSRGHGSGGHLVLSCWSQCPPPMEPGVGTRPASQQTQPGAGLVRIRASGTGS